MQRFRAAILDQYRAIVARDIGGAATARAASEAIRADIGDRGSADLACAMFVERVELILAAMAVQDSAATDAAEQVGQLLEAQNRTNGQVNRLDLVSG